MTFRHGRKAVALFAGVNITSYITDASLDVDVDAAETTTWGNDWKTYIPGQAMSKYGFTGYFDAAMTPTFTSQVGDNPAGLLLVAPGGMVVGERANIMEVIETKYGESAPVGGVVGFTWDAMADTVPGFGQVLTTLTAVTADGNGTAVDGGAATTTGGVAHLHVLDVSASDSIVVTIEDSANGSTGWATIATFASRSAAGAERVTIAGTIKRYVRAVDDVTGTGVSIIRAVALARNAT